MVADDAKTNLALKAFYIVVELIPKIPVLQTVYGPLKALLLIIKCHTGTLGAQVRMVIRSVKNIHYTVALSHHSEKSTHNFVFLRFWNSKNKGIIQNYLQSETQPEFLWQCNLQHIVKIFHKMHAKSLFHMLRKRLKILSIFGRKNQLKYLHPFRCNGLFLNPANRQDLSGK